MLVKLLLYVTVLAKRNHHLSISHLSRRMHRLHEAPRQSATAKWQARLGQLATEARALEKGHKALMERLVKKRTAIVGGESTPGVEGPRPAAAAQPRAAH